MAALTKPFRRRDLRYYIKTNNDITVTIETDDARSEPIRAKLVNISAGGAMFEAGKAFSDKEIVTVRIEVTSPMRTMVVSGEVRWVSPTAGDAWRFGCSLTPSVPKEVLHDFASAGILERREHRREPISINAVAKWELAAETAAVSLLNYSRGGFCLLRRTECECGERVLLRIKQGDEREVLIPGRARWQVESEEGFVIGCEFLNSQDFTLLKRMKNAKPPEETKPNRQVARRHWPWVVGALSAALLCIVICTSRLPGPLGNQRVEFAGMAGPGNSLENKSNVEQLNHSHPTDSTQDQQRIAVQSGNSPIAVERPFGASISAEYVMEIASLPEFSGERRNLGTFSVGHPVVDAIASSKPTIPKQSAWAPTTAACSPLVYDMTQDAGHLQAANRQTLGDESMIIGESLCLAPRAIDLPRRAPEVGAPMRRHSLTPSFEVALPFARSISQDTDAAIGGATPIRAGNKESAGGFNREPRLAHLAKTPLCHDLSPSNKSAATPVSVRRNREQAAEAFRQGRLSYKLGRHEQAAASLQTAIQNDSGNALYFYFLAMVQYELKRYDQAESSVKKAVELEREQPVEGWGRTMERHQGRVRVWLEETRGRMRGA